MEASTGIEPVYTDLQSAASPLRQLAQEHNYLDLVLRRILTLTPTQAQEQVSCFADKIVLSCLQRRWVLL